MLHFKRLRIRIAFYGGSVIEQLKLNIIGTIHTPFAQKFAIPRQSQALSSAQGRIAFHKDINPVNACREIATFSHLWLSFVFHENLEKGWKDTVRPPRLGGNKRVGVFASRSTFRPCPIGLSLVRNLGLNQNNELIVAGVDLVDATPILDIKPYLPYADCAPAASSGYIDQAEIAKLRVELTPQAECDLQQIEVIHSDFRPLLCEILAQDPRPAYKQKGQDEKSYALQLYRFDVHWRVNDKGVEVMKITHA